MRTSAGRIVPFAAVSVALHAAVLAPAAPNWPMIAPAPVGEDRTVSVRLEGASASETDDSDPERYDRESPAESDAKEADRIADRSPSEQPDPGDGNRSPADAESASADSKPYDHVPKLQPSQSGDGLLAKMESESESEPDPDPQRKPESEPEIEPPPDTQPEPEPDPRPHPEEQPEPAPDSPPSTAEAQAAEPAERDDASSEADAAAEEKRVRSEVATQLAEHFQYPRLAQRRGWQGRVVLAFEVRPDGEVADIRVVESSGRSILDDAAREALERVGRLPRVRAGSLSAPLPLKIPVTYRLQSA